jgi:hypothetical protein
MTYVSSTTATNDALAGIDERQQPFAISLQINSPAVHFVINDRQKEKKKNFGGGVVGVIGLPVPANLSTGYGMAYDTGTGLGVLGSQAYQAARNSGDVQGIVQNLAGDNAIDAVKQAAVASAASVGPQIAAALGAAAASGMVGAAAGAAVGNALGGIGQGALAGAGLAVNPHLAVLFTGPRFRVHQFNYKITPKSAGESTALTETIKQFKLAMAPSVDGLAFFDYPNEFYIRFPANSQHLFRIGASVLTDFTVNYTPDGGSYFHDNGAPVSVAMSLSFTEIDVITKAKIQEGR